jgi:hypothetical protein
MPQLKRDINSKETYIMRVCAAEYRDNAYEMKNGLCIAGRQPLNQKQCRANKTRGLSN